MCCLNKNITLWISQNTFIAAAQLCARLGSFKNSTKAQLTVATEEFFFCLFFLTQSQTSSTSEPLTILVATKRNLDLKNTENTIHLLQGPSGCWYEAGVKCFWSSGQLTSSCSCESSLPGSEALTQSRKMHNQNVTLVSFTTQRHNQSCSNYPN